jgi:spermidine synthase
LHGKTSDKKRHDFNIFINLFQQASIRASKKNKLAASLFQYFILPKFSIILFLSKIFQMFQKLFSYFIPVNVYRRNSSVSKSLEVTWNNGQLVLDSKHTNYSYGSLQRILRKGLKYIGFERIRNFENVLVLGVAGGSVIKTLVDEIKFTGKITGVEIDEHIIKIANDYFNLESIPNLELVIDDAFEFVLKTKLTYDLIIIDIFQDTKMPNFLFEDFFINRVNALLNVNGFILFNTMVITQNQKDRNKNYKSKFNANYSLRLYPKVEEHNELFTIKKLAN